MNNELYLAHHGVKGMKWGVRRARNRIGSAYSNMQSRRANITPEQRARRRKMMKRAAIGVGTAAAVGGSLYLTKTGQGRALSRRALRNANRMRLNAKNGSIIATRRAKAGLAEARRRGRNTARYMKNQHFNDRARKVSNAARYGANKVSYNTKRGIKAASSFAKKGAKATSSYRKHYSNIIKRDPIVRKASKTLDRVAPYYSKRRAMLEVGAAHGRKIAIASGIKATSRGIKATSRGIKAASQGIKATSRLAKKSASEAYGKHVQKKRRSKKAKRS